VAVVETRGSEVYQKSAYARVNCSAYHRYSDAQDIDRVAILRHPVFLVKTFTQHARKGQPNAYQLATVSPDQQALPRGQHMAQLCTQISCGRRLAHAQLAVGGLSHRQMTSSGWLR